MESTATFTDRLQKLLKYYDLSASGFASKIGVQRSSMSHIISGRNKPSLDFVMKLLHHFNEVSIEWLIDGNGTFPKSDTPAPSIKNTLIENTIIENINPTIEKEKSEPITNQIVTEISSKKNTDKNVAKIILLYTDGSFEAFQN